MNKYIKKIISIVLSVSIILAFSGCSLINKTQQKYSYEFFGVFDTIIQVTGYASSQKEFDAYSEYAYQRFNELNELFDNYNTYEGINNIKSINDNAGITAVEVSGEIIDLLKFALDSYENISDKADISMGAVLWVWHTFRDAGLEDAENAALPTQDELTAANKYTGIDNIIIDSENSTVYLNEGTMLDLGAVAKGYATELVANELYDMGFESFFISSGGNVKTVGSPVDDDKNNWSIGIQNPFYFDDSENNESLIEIAYVSDISVVTSGDYQRYYTVDGTDYHHLIDPDTLYPAEYFRSVTILAKDSGLADFLSTALFLTPYEEGLALIENIEGAEAYWVFYDGTVAATDGALQYLKYLGGATN